VLLAAASLMACEEFDPVRTVDLCTSGHGVISAKCEVCLQTPYAPECPRCQEPERDQQCAPPTGQTSGAMTTNADAGDGSTGVAPGSSPAADGSSPGGAAASGSPGSGGMSGSQPGPNGQPGQPGPNGQPGQPGANGQPSAGSMASGAGGMSGDTKSLFCSVDGDCKDPAKPACSFQTRMCVPCQQNSDCPTSKPVCDLDLNECVVCMKDVHCTDKVLGTCSTKLECVDCEAGSGCLDPDKPACVGQTCLQCTVDAQCRQPTPKCNVDNTCVQCLANTDCTDASKPLCALQPDDPGLHSCVQCFTDDDCHSPGQSHCQDNSCVACTDSSQCTRLTGTAVCDVERGAGCVECVDNTSTKTCAGNACIITKRECSTVSFRSLPACSRCESDAECGPNMFCVTMAFGSATDRLFCALDSATSGGCVMLRGYTQTVTLKSVDGAQRAVCLPPLSTTCEGVADTIKHASCRGAADCGAVDLADGHCGETTMQCTYGCKKPEDCPAGMTCGTSQDCEISP
jgi:hypothetical protein